MRTRRVTPWRALLGLVVQLTCFGCIGQNTYVVEISPRDQGLERQITIYRIQVSGGVERRVAPRLEWDQASRLERAYGVAPDTLTSTASLDKRPPFVAQRFFATIPDDIGNWGSLRDDRSLLGRTWTYAERFRGDTDPSTALNLQLAIADSVADLVLGWATSELERHPRWSGLHDFLAGDVRQQLRNTTALCWVGAASGDSTALWRLMVDLEEHSTVRDLLTFSGFFGELPRDAAIAGLRATFARALDLRSPAEIRRTLGFLANPDSADRSLARYLTGRMTDSSADARELWSAVVARMLGSLGMSPTDSIQVSLAAPVKPDATNGTWDAALGRVSWAGRISDEPPLLPFTSFAHWSVPDSARQRRIFGTTLLAGEDLGDYDLWFVSLSAAKQREWDRMLLRLKPGNLRPVERFRFADEIASLGSAQDSTAPSLADEPRRRILDAAKRGK